MEMKIISNTEINEIIKDAKQASLPNWEDNYYYFINTQGIGEEVEKYLDDVKPSNIIVLLEELLHLRNLSIRNSWK
jgi:hypothetical protein